MNFALASSLIRGKWAIDPMFALNSLGMVADILNGNIAIEKSTKPIFTLSSAVIKTDKVVAANQSNDDASSTGFVSLVRFEGALMKSDQECGPAGMESIGNALINLDNNPEVLSHVLLFDTPGGTVDGTEVLGNIIKNLKKPSIGFISGQCASAGLWLASNATERYASTELDEIGSVGVLLSFADMQPYYEKEGVKFHKIVSNLSPDKTKIWDDIRAGNYKEYKEIFLDPIGQKFQSIIKANLPNVTDEHLTGKVFHARDLINIMIDGISTFDQAIERAAQLGAQANKPATTQALSPIKNKVSMKLPKLMAILALTELVAEDGFSSLSQEHLQAIEAALPEADAPDAALLASQLQTANDTIAQLNAGIAGLETDNEALRNKPAEAPARVTPSADAAPVSEASKTVVKPGMSLQEQINAVKKEYNI